MVADAAANRREGVLFQIEAVGFFEKPLLDKRYESSNIHTSRTSLDTRGDFIYEYGSKGRSPSPGLQ
jgi:hypothetical protein